MRALCYCGCLLFVSGAVTGVEERLPQCHIEEINSNMIQMVDSVQPVNESLDEDREFMTEDLGFSVMKYTVAGDKGARPAFTFLSRYMKTQPSIDTPCGNVIACEGAPSFFVARNDLIKDGAGTCVLVTSPGIDPVHLSGTTTEDADGVTAVVLGNDAFSDCTLVDNKSFSFESGHLIEVAADTEKQCCLACQGDADCIGANFAPGPWSEPYVAFGIHVPSSTVRSTGSGFDVGTIEDIVNIKLRKLKEFDAWMDYSLGLWTTDLDPYMQAFDSAGVDYLAARWTTGTINAFSVFVHVEDSQLILELMTANPTKLQHQEGLVHLEPRLPEAFTRHTMQQEVPGSVLREVRISRAATDLDAVDYFYLTGMRIRQSLALEGEEVSVRCYEWSVGTPQICYTKRPASKTRGWFKVDDFENVLKTSAREWYDNAFCIKNRWFDNHYSVSTHELSDPQAYDYIIDFLDQHPEIPIACDPSAGLYYIIDPSGWAVQTPFGIGSVLPMRCGGDSISIGLSFNTTADFVFCDMGDCSEP